MKVLTRLPEIRKQQGIAVTELSRRSGVSRQTIHAIEAGEYVPNTAVALRLARELRVDVEALFRLDEGDETPPVIETEALARIRAAGAPVRVCRVGERWVSVPAGRVRFFLPEADGVLAESRDDAEPARVSLAAALNDAEHRLLIAGCDPAASLLASAVERASGVQVLTTPASSRSALTLLKEGKVHIAGSHLEDPRTGEFNLPQIRKLFRPKEVLVVTFAVWQEGWVVYGGNPKEIRKPEDLTRYGVGLVNREPGSGCRILLDNMMAKAGVRPEKVLGYGEIALGHLPAAEAIHHGHADVCIATEAAARLFRLDFLPLHESRYDLVMRRETAELPAVRILLDVLQRGDFRRKLSLVAGYSTNMSGTVRSL